MADLQEVFGNSDKVTAGYLPYYQEIAAQIGRTANVLEVGVWMGDSLRLWQAMFQKGRIAGADDFSYHLVHHKQINWPVGTYQIGCEQTDPFLKTEAIKFCPEGYDMIVDDASHFGSKSQATWEMLWPIVKPGGFYVLEDWYVGQPFSDFYPHFEGTSMADFAVSFMNKLNPESDVADIRYVNTGGGMAILHKKTS